MQTDLQGGEEEPGDTKLTQMLAQLYHKETMEVQNPSFLGILDDKGSLHMHIRLTNMMNQSRKQFNPNSFASGENKGKSVTTFS